MFNQKSIEASLRNLEVQVGHFVEKLEDKLEKNYEANIEPNPEEHCKDITTKSGKVLDGRPKMQDKVKEEDIVEKNDIDEGIEEEGKKKNEQEIRKGKQVVEPLPYPYIHSRKEKDKHFSRFMVTFKKLEITIPFIEALQQMPSYVRFMKDFLQRKGNILKKILLKSRGIVMLSNFKNCLVQRFNKTFFLAKSHLM